MYDENNINEVIEYSLKNENNLCIALILHDKKNFNLLKNKILEKFFDRLKNHFPEGHRDRIENTITLELNDGCYSIPIFAGFYYNYSTPDCDIKISLEAQAEDFSDIIKGYKKLREGDNLIPPELINKMNESYQNVTSNNSDYWYWYIKDDVFETYLEKNKERDFPDDKILLDMAFSERTLDYVRDEILGLKNILDNFFHVQA